MMNKKTRMPYVSVIIVNFNGRQDLEESLPYLTKQNYNNYEIIVVDNASKDDSVDFIRDRYPQVKVIEAGKNLGFGAGNNLGVRNAVGELIVFTNYDAEFDNNWLRYLVECAIDDDKIGMVAPKILLYGSDRKLQTVGLALQYTGHAFSRGLGQDEALFSHVVELPCVSGCSFLVKRHVLDEVGVFDEKYHDLDKRFFHSSLEDVDLSWRVLLTGYRIVYEDRAVMYHKYMPKPMTLLRYVYIERGRMYTLLKNYRCSTLLALLPALGFAEIISITYSATRGPKFLMTKIGSYFWLLKSRATIIEAHRATQKLRKTSDTKIMHLLQAETELRHAPLPGCLVGPLSNMINICFRVLYLHSYGLVKIGGMVRSSLR